MRYLIDTRSGRICQKTAKPFPVNPVLIWLELDDDNLTEHTHYIETVDGKHELKVKESLEI